MRTTDEYQLVTPGNRRCLGWCGKDFMSPNKKVICYCEKCSIRKQHLERELHSCDRRISPGIAVPCEGY